MPHVPQRPVYQCFCWWFGVFRFSPCGAVWLNMGAYCAACRGIVVRVKPLTHRFCPPQCTLHRLPAIVPRRIINIAATPSGIHSSPTLAPRWGLSHFPVYMRHVALPNRQRRGPLDLLILRQSHIVLKQQLLSLFLVREFPWCSKRLINSTI